MIHSHLNTANSNGGDQYTGLDRYGRVVDQNWIDDGNASGAGGTLDRYSYDAYGNHQTLNASWTSTTDSYNWNILYSHGGCARYTTGTEAAQHTTFDPAKSERYG